MKIYFLGYPTSLIAEYPTKADYHNNSESKFVMPESNSIVKVQDEDVVSENSRKSENLKTVELQSVGSAYELRETGQPDSFCSGTISWYNPYLRHYHNFCCLFTTVCMYLASYMFFFNARYASHEVEGFSDVFYAYVMILRSRTGYSINGVEERNLLKIREHYQSSFGFIVDVFTMIPFSVLKWFFSGSDEIFHAVTRQKIYLRMYYILYYIGMRETEPGSSTLLYRTTKYLLFSSLTVHLAACGWYGLACPRPNQSGFSINQCYPGSWINYLSSQNGSEDLLSQSGHEDSTDNKLIYLRNTYITSLYWSSATATSTGYGDFYSHTISEKLYSIAAMIIGITIVYGMTIGGITSMLTNIDARRSSFVHRYKAFEKEVNNMDVSDKIKQFCLKYFNYLWHRYDGENVQTCGVLDILPEPLRTTFARATFYNLLHKADLLDATGDAFCRNLALVSQPMIYLENQFIQKSGEIANNMCYIHYGVVEVLDANERDVVALMHPGKLFGQILLVFDLPRINSIRCKTNCDVFLLNRHDFKQVLAEYPEAAQKFVQAAREKCVGPLKQWPMNPPTLASFTNYIEKVESHSRRSSIGTLSSTNSNRSSNTSGSMTRRMSTVYAHDYEGVDLSRVRIQHANRTNKLELELAPINSENKLSTVDFVKKNEMSETKRSSINLLDGTVMIAANANCEDLREAVGPDSQYYNLDVLSWKERLYKATIVYPKGRFYIFWLNYLFIVSSLAGLYTTFMAFFTTTSGKAISFSGEDAETLDLVNIASNTCNTTEKGLYSACSLGNFGAVADCLKNAEGTFASHISKSANNYTITVPAWYDINLVGYNPYTVEGRCHIFISYFIVDVSFYLNILVNLRTGLLTPNEFFTGFKDIFASYNKWNRLWLDIFAVFPFEIISPLIGCTRIASYHAMTFLRLNRVIYFLRYVPSTFSRWERSLNVKILHIRTLKFVTYIYTFTHMCACLFYWWSCSYVVQSHQVSISYKCRSDSWAWIANIDYHTSRGQDYITTMYWATTTMTSTGYGDIVASTTIDRVFALITMIIGTVLYGWLVAVIASTVSNSHAAKVPYALVYRVMTARCIEWERYAGTAIPGEQVIGRELSDQLRSVLMYENINYLVQHMPFFYGIDPSFIAMLCNHVMIFHYSEGDILLYEGDLSRNLYIIKKGRCDVVTEDLSESINHLYPGDYFGEVEMLFGCSSPRTVVAVATCEVLVFQREDVDAVLESFPILQVQMQKIVEDTSYKYRVLQAIKQRNLTVRQGINMLKLYKVAYIEHETQLYAERRKPLPLILTLNDSETTLHAATSSLKRRWLFRFLLCLTFDPMSKSYLIYETIRFFLTISTILIVPMQFAILPNDTIALTMQYILDFLCLLDQYIKAHTAYFNENAVLVTHPVLTAEHYLQSSFIVDLISYFPFELLVYVGLPKPLSQQQWRLISFFRFPRLLQMYKIFSFFYFWLYDIRTSKRWVKHLSSALYGIIIHHWFACLLFATACPPELTNNDSQYATTPDMIQLNATGSITYCLNSTWIGHIISRNTFPSLHLTQSLLDQYVVTLYWTTATLTCVGYGDIYARLVIEMFMATIVMISGTVFYSYILGDISAHIQTDDISRGHYKGRLSDILKFFRNYQVTKETQQQVLNYYCYLWDRTRGVTPDDLLKGLSPSIRASVCQSMYGKMVGKAFGESGDVDKETEGFFRLLSNHLKPFVYLKHSIICRRGDIGEEMFFIQRGKVAILDEEEENVVKVLEPGQHFGEIALLFTTPRIRTISALTNCDLNLLGKKDLDDILTKFPRFRDRMIAIAHDRQLRGTRSAIFYPLQSNILQNRGDDKASNHIFPEIFGRESTFIMLWNHITVPLAFFSSSLCIYQACFCSHYPILHILGYSMDICVLVVRLYKFILCICFCISALGSIWYALACPNGKCKIYSWASSSKTAYMRNGVHGYDILPYVDSLYWVVATMTSTGYGDIKPENQWEMVYACMVMIAGKLMIGYVLGMVAATLANDESLKVWYEKRVMSVRRYMTELQFDSELYDHVIQYYDYVWMKNQGVNVMELFPDLSFSLRADIYNQICREMVNNIELFQGCPDNFLRHLCMVMVPTAYMPGDYICLQGDIRSQMYVVRYGIAEALKRVDGKKIPIRLVKEGEHFLSESVLCKVRRPCSLRARTYVDVFGMTMDGLQSVLRHHPGVGGIVLTNARRLFPKLLL